MGSHTDSNDHQEEFSVVVKGHDQDKFLQYLAMFGEKAPYHHRWLFQHRCDSNVSSQHYFAPYLGEFIWKDINGETSFRIVYKEYGKPLNVNTIDRTQVHSKIEVFHDNLDVLQAFIKRAISYVDPIEDDKVTIYTSDSKGYWINNDSVHVQGIEHIYLNDEVKTQVIAAFDHFIKPETCARYVRYGRRYKMGMLFSGPPGSGKTSLSMALAKKYKRRIYILNISKTLTDEPMTSLISEIKPDSILLIEDIDCYFQDRKAVDVNIGFSCFLNILDGCLAASNGLIMIMCANHPQNIDQALVRPGRVDRFVKFEYPTRSQVAQAFKDLVEVDAMSEGANFQEFYDRIRGIRISMAGIVDFLFNHPLDYMETINELLQNTQYAADIVNDISEKGLYV